MWSASVYMDCFLVLNLCRQIKGTKSKMRALKEQGISQAVALNILAKQVC